MATMPVVPTYLERDVQVVIQRLADTLEVPLSSVSTTYRFYTIHNKWLWSVDVILEDEPNIHVRTESLADAVIAAAAEYVNRK